MKTIRQLLRQPMKTIMGILLAALAAAVLCICVGQNISSGQIKDRLDEMFSTQALPTYQYTKESDEWALKYAREHPEIVTAVGSPGLISGYLPELQPDSYTSYLGLQKNLNQNYKYSTSPEYVTEYGDAILEFQLDVIGDTTVEGYQILRGTILNVVKMNDTHTDPTGYNVQIHWYGEDVELQIGERYLLYTDSYTDLDWKLRSELTQMVDSFSPLIPVITPENVSFVAGFDPETVNFCKASGASGLSTEVVASVATYCDGFKEDDKGELVPMRYPVFLDMTERDLYSYRTVLCVLRDGTEYGEDYRQPTLVRLESTAQDFLDSPEGTAWQEALEILTVNNHAYPFIGIDTLNDIPTFAGSTAAMAQGRSFTDAELEQGAKVCMISAELAALNGLEVGDTISPQFYERDPDLGAGITEGYGVVNPQANPYDPNTNHLEEAETYTIIGIYQQSAVRESVDRNLYGFTPNTIFVPKASVTAEMDYSHMGLFRCFHLVNGTAEEFIQAARDAGFSGAFMSEDHNYAEMESTMQAYIANAQKMLGIGLAAYAVMLALMVVLYPLQQNRVLRTMDSLGADRTLRRKHMMVSNLGLFLPGTALGIWASTYLWDMISASLTEGNEAVLSVEVNLGMLLTIGLVHIIGLMGILWGCAVLMTRPQNLMNSRDTTSEAADPKTRKSVPALAVMALGVVLSVAMCGLHMVSQAEQENYENMSLTLPIYVTVTDLTGAQDDNLGMDTWVWDVFTSEEYLGNYFNEEDVKYKLTMNGVYHVTVNDRAVDCEQLAGIRDISADSNLLQAGDDAITWLDGYGDWVLESDQNLCVIPVEYLPADRGTPVKVVITTKTSSGREYTHEDGTKYKESGYEYQSYEFYVAGVHQCGSNAIYCPAQTIWCRNEYIDTAWSVYPTSLTLNYSERAMDLIEEMEESEELYTYAQMLEVLQTDPELLQDIDLDGNLSPWPENLKLSFSRNMDEYKQSQIETGGYTLRDRIVATLADNSTLNTFRYAFKSYFVEPTPSGKLTPWRDSLSRTGYYPYALRIEDEQYRAAQAALNSSMAISIGCTIAIFGLSIAASFLIAFLMIRAKSHEIMLMRTLGAPPIRICMDALREQLISFLIGVGLGGLFFLWQPPVQLISLVLIFFAGLCVALTVFMNNNLMTIQKEDE